MEMSLLSGKLLILVVVCIEFKHYNLQLFNTFYFIYSNKIILFY